MDKLIQNISSSVSFIKSIIGSYKPEYGLILGSGLGALANEIENPITIKYCDIPGFFTSTIEGHQGKLVVGILRGKATIAMQGRFHFYEGHSMQDITLPIRVMVKLGIEKLIVTNACGAVNERFKPGDLMIITDHINFGFSNPLLGKNLDDFGSRFTDTSQCYDNDLMNCAKKCAEISKIQLKEGIYQYFSGPSYETPSEIKVARSLGADVVGMSTVPEVLVAVHCGLRVLGISCITNMGAGILNQPLGHEEVIETSKLVNKKFISLVKNIIEKA